MTSTHQLQTISITEDPTNFINRGMLTSQYKEEIKYNNRNGSSLFNLKQRIKTNHHRFMPAAGTILKVSVFVIAYLIAFM